MADRGTIFSAPMVRALLDGRKSQTRRLLKKPLPPEDADRVHAWFAPPEIPARGVPGQWAESGLWAVQHIAGGEDGEPASGGYNRYCGPLPYRPGDRLYVRENFRLDIAYDKMKPRLVAPEAAVWYEAGGKVGDGVPGKLHPCIHLPRWASRLTLTVTDVRVQRVQEISDADARAEGIAPVPFVNIEGDTVVGWHADPNAEAWDTSSTPQRAFEALWNSLHTKPGETWTDNPWVVAVSFDVRHGNIDRGE